MEKPLFATIHNFSCPTCCFQAACIIVDRFHKWTRVYFSEQALDSKCVMFQLVVSIICLELFDSDTRLLLSFALLIY